MQKTPSSTDLLSYFKNVVEGYLLNEKGVITSHHSSAYGLTSYKVKSNEELSSAIRIAYENEEESKKHLEALEDNVQYFFEENCYIYKAKKKSYKKKKKNIINFSAEGGKESNSFYVQFIPTNSKGELLWK